jgi:hypothetical protein
MKTFKVRFLIGVLLLSFSRMICAQSTTGTIYGTVTDASGGLVPGVSITAVNVDSHATRTQRSSGAGEFQFQSLDPGNYQVTATAAGFHAVTQTGISLSANQNVQASFHLQAGEVSQAVTVTADSTLVDTRGSQLAQTVDQQKIEDLPSLNRSAYALTQTLPGVTNYTEQAVVGGATGNEFSLNGLRPNFNSYYLDGSFNTAIYRGGGNLIPNPDALQEFRVLTSNSDVEFGRYPGAVVNVITRSGTASFHGLAYDYLRNNVFNAKNYFQTSVSPLRQNQFGGNVGGPLLRNRAFLFLSYEGLRIRSVYTVTSSSLFTPTAAEAGGDFTNAKVKPHQANGTPYTCNGVTNVICPNLLDPVAQAMLTLVPLSTAASANDSGGNPAQQTAPNRTNLDQGLARLDYQLTANNKIALTFFNAQGTTQVWNSGGNQILDYGGQTQFGHQVNGILGDTWILSAHAVNDLRMFYSRNLLIVSHIHPGLDWASFGSNIAEGSSSSTQPMITINGYWIMGSGGSGDNEIDQAVLGISDTFHLSRGHHEMKFGGSFFWNHYEETGTFLGSGKLTFNGGTTGNALADYLVGSSSSFTQNSGDYHRYHSPNPALFAQDDWRIARRLTLNLGLRWETFPPLRGRNDLGTFTQGVQSQRFPTAPLGLLFAEDPGVPDGIFHTSYLKFAPRVGFALDVFGNGRTSLRGAYGIFYAAGQPFALSVVTSATPRYANKNAGLVDPYAPGVDPFPYIVNPQNPTFSNSASVVGIRPGSSSVPYVQEFNLTIDQQLSTNWGTQISYIGNTSREFILAIDQNVPAFVPGAAVTTAGLNARRPIKPYGQITLLDPSSNASYNSLVATITKKMNHRFSLLASYVWSRNIDDVSTDPSNATNFALSNQTSIAMDRAASTLEVPQRFVASYLYALPDVKRFGFIGKQVLSGWQINGVTTLASGNPFNILSGKDTNLDGIASDRPNLLADPRLPNSRSRAAKIKQFFNPAAFAPVTNPNQPYGTSPRDPLNGPGYINTDISAFKTFYLFRESTLQFRGEVFNVFNNVNLSNPVATENSGNFAAITSSGQPRIAQFALKLAF